MLRNNLLEGVIPVIILILWFAMFIGIFSLIVFAIVRHFRKKAENDRMPQETLRARVVSKRTDVWGDHATTSYFVTFELDTRARVEMQVKGEEFGMLAEGDEGVLTHQGTRYLGFSRF